MTQGDFREAFDAALAIWGVNVNLTMGLFWIRPHEFLSLDATNRSYLDIDLKPGLSFDFYSQSLQSIREQDDRPFPEISYASYLQATSEQEVAKKVTVSNEESYWFVGAYWSDREPKDQTQEFMDEGVWKNGYTDRFLDEVKQMKVGERIAIKAVSTQKKNLPFDARGNTASRMTIKAIGTIVANRGDGRTVEVEWDSSFTPRDWYFFTYQQTVWRLTLTEDYQHRDLAKRLIEFTFGGADQDYDWFCNRWYGEEDQPPVPVVDTPQPYSIDDIIAEGAFLTEAALTQTLDRLTTKKNLILQGAPGVGKTFLARRLGFALMEERATDRLEFVQFHQSYSYEDFVRGFRPVADRAGTFSLQDGVFFRFCEKAKDDPDRPYVFIIDEINRGNLSQIFGELLMLVEADKRGPDFNLPLMYPRNESERFHVPANLYLIGLMNLADRSLALVDYALRRRFAFVTLEPQYSSNVYRKWLVDRGMPESLVDLIVERMSALNDEIASDELLGTNYRVGHSFFCPKGDNFEALNRAWYTAIVETEIAPLLNEYWFDNPSRAEEARQRLLS